MSLGDPQAEEPLVDTSPSWEKGWMVEPGSEPFDSKELSVALPFKQG